MGLLFKAVLCRKLRLREVKSFDSGLPAEFASGTILSVNCEVL